MGVGVVATKRLLDARFFLAGSHAAGTPWLEAAGTMLLIVMPLSKVNRKSR